LPQDFNSFSLQGWVAASFTLSQTVFILFCGQLLRIFPAKWVLICSIIIFEAGSLLCALSQNVHQLIAGRAISGPGAAGICTCNFPPWSSSDKFPVVGMLQIVAQVTRLEDRPRLFGLFGANFALSSVIGPLLGGVFTDKISWRSLFFYLFSRAHFTKIKLDGASLLISHLAVSPSLGWHFC
jgi:MFS family permease